MGMGIPCECFVLSPINSAVLYKGFVCPHLERWYSTRRQTSTPAPVNPTRPTRRSSFPAPAPVASSSSHQTYYATEKVAGIPVASSILSSDDSRGEETPSVFE